MSIILFFRSTLMKSCLYIMNREALYNLQNIDSLFHLSKHQFTNIYMFQDFDFILSKILALSLGYLYQDIQYL